MRRETGFARRQPAGFIRIGRMERFGKRFFVLGLLLLLCAVFPVAAGAQPRVELSEKEHKFGTIGERDGEVNCRFRFRNAGDAPLVVLAAAVNCKCTKVDYPKRPVLPGEEAVVTVTYDPRRQSGTFYKTITLRTNAPEGRTILIVSGTVVPSK